MSVRLLPRHTWRWWFLNWGTLGARQRFPRLQAFQRMTLAPSSQYAPGVSWSVRFGPIVLTRYAACNH